VDRAQTRHSDYQVSAMGREVGGGKEKSEKNVIYPSREASKASSEKKGKDYTEGMANSQRSVHERFRKKKKKKKKKKKEKKKKKKK